MHIDNLKADIELTAEQEEEIIGLLEKLYDDRAISAQKADRSEQIAGKKLDYENYTIALDSVLTGEQRAELERKTEERKNEINL
jgi:Spy/CpxP family protein refolding chaperone